MVLAPLNPAGALEAPITSQFAFLRRKRRATDQRRYAALESVRVDVPVFSQAIEMKSP
jgi:hypothetical protein